MSKLILKIKRAGQVISLPGMADFRTPAKVDVSRIPINIVILKLKALGIDEYEIMSEIEGKKVVYKKEDLTKKKSKSNKDAQYLKHVDKRLNRMENMISKLVNGISNLGQDNITKEKEQNKKLDSLEELLKEQKNLKQIVYSSGEKTKDDPTIEELDDMFIPTIDVEGMKIKGGDHKILKQDDEVSDSADLLATMQIKRKGNK